MWAIGFSLNRQFKKNTSRRSRLRYQGEPYAQVDEPFEKAGVQEGYRSLAALRHLPIKTPMRAD
jgi:hypothetical protein